MKVIKLPKKETNEFQRGVSQCSSCRQVWFVSVSCDVPFYALECPSCGCCNNAYIPNEMIDPNNLYDKRWKEAEKQWDGNDSE